MGDLRGTNNIVHAVLASCTGVDIYIQATFQNSIQLSHHRSLGNGAFGKKLVRLVSLDGGRGAEETSVWRDVRVPRGSSRTTMGVKGNVVQRRCEFTT